LPRGRPKKKPAEALEAEEDLDIKEEVNGDKN
jgi:hypothetical protein